MTKTRSLVWPLFILFLFAFAGCATMFSDSEDEVQFDSRPSGATVTMNGKELGKTPLKIKIKRKSETASVTFSKEGYLPYSVDLVKNLAPVALFNFGFITTTSGATSWGVDALSGKMLKYDERAYVAELGKRTSSIHAPSALEFAITRFESLRAESVNGMGESFVAFCGLYGFGPSRCEAFYSKVHAAGTQLAAAPHALAWFDTVDALAAI